MPNIFPLQPKIISVHIPKTAGSSVHAVMKNKFGWQLKHMHKKADLDAMSVGEYTHTNKPFVRAIHGHVRPHQNWKKHYKNAQWTCWLREPTERVISAYYHLEKSQHLPGISEQRFAKDQPTLQAFLVHPAFRGIVETYKHFLGNVAPSDFKFVGRTEHFEEDLARFNALIGNTEKVQPRENIGKNKRPVAPELYEEIKAQLAGEYEIYNRYINHFYS